MGRLLPLALLVPFVAGCGWGSMLFGGHATSSQRSTGHIRVYPVKPVRQVSRWTKVEQLAKKAIPGANVFASAGCVVCHIYAGTGSRQLGAPALTSIGRRHLGIQFQIAHLECPSCVVKESPMPPFGRLGKRRLHQVAVFLEASKGTH
jgi:cbb3-type cytochrome oxidase cytochrome c subunit